MITPRSKIWPPHTPHGALQALGLDRAVPAQGLRPLQLGGSLGEPQVGVARAARQVQAAAAGRGEPGTQRPGAAAELLGMDGSAVQRN